MRDGRPRAPVPRGRECEDPLDYAGTIWADVAFACDATKLSQIRQAHVSPERVRSTSRSTVTIILGVVVVLIIGVLIVAELIGGLLVYLRKRRVGAVR